MKLYLGIDVGGTSAKAGVVDSEGKILYKSSCPTGIERAFEAIVADMADLCKRVVQESGHSMEEIQSVGVGIPGEQSPETGLVALCNNLGWHDVPLMGTLKKLLGKPVYVDNDANVAALAESWAGVSRDVKSSVLVTLGTGVGGGFDIVRDCMHNDTIRGFMNKMLHEEIIPPCRWTRRIWKSLLPLLRTASTTPSSTTS